MAAVVGKVGSAADWPTAQDYRGSGRQAALRRFAIAITLLTLLGHTVLGFEQSIAQPLVALGTAYGLQILFEWIYATGNGLRPKYAGGFERLVDFLLPAHIAALAIAMLMYFNDRLSVVVFSVAIAIASKFVLRVPTADGSTHIFNPSNLALCTTFVLYPSVGLAMPWQWTTELSGTADWIFPVLIICTGTLLHIKYAGRIWVVISFLVAFLVQGVIRSLFVDMNLLAALAPATGVPAAIFTFYMAPDPATSPVLRGRQMLFGASIAFVYMALVMLHVLYALFFALAIVCLVRGMCIFYQWARSSSPALTT